MAKNLKFNIFRPILAILLIFIPLYPKFPLFSVDNTYVSIRLDDIVTTICLFFLLIDQLKYKFNLVKTPLAKLMIIYFLALLITLLNAIFILQTDYPNILLLHTLRKIQYMLLAFISIKAVNSKKDFKYPLIFIVIASIFVAIYGYGQKYFSFPIISTMNEEFSKGYLLTLTIWSRISSTFAGHYDLAAFLSVFLVVLAGSITQTKAKLTKILLILVWLILFHLLTQTASRVSIFALWGGLIVCFLLIKKYLLIIPSSVIIIFSFFNSTELNQRLLATINTISPQLKISKPTQIPPAPTAIPTIVPTPIGKTEPQIVTTPKPTIVRHKQEPYPQVDVDAGVSRSGEIRFNVEWPRAITAFNKNPLIGTGPGSLGLATDNEFLRSLGETGLLGFLSLMMIPIYFIIKTVQSKNKLNYVFMASVLTFLANAVFIDVFSASKTAYLFWLMMGIYYQNLNLNDKI